MEIFEIHITGSPSINEEFDRLGIKNIVIDLLKPNKEVLRTEYMCSMVSKHKNLNECLHHVQSILDQLTSKVIRVKVESPYYEHYKDQALYLESHFPPMYPDLPLYPISRNTKSGKLLATDRVYDKKAYRDFVEKWKHVELEMCLVDSFVDEDKDWFELYINE